MSTEYQVDAVRCAECGEAVLVGHDAIFDERPTDTYETSSYYHKACAENLRRDESEWAREELGVENAREEGKL